ncbi:hypothetical protein Taro_033208 [Colocasia esculenta]|uniref:OVATE domain-containing protein n=1 Tax=Colocasia esculenta TaxID=4460 RepID=A0A843WBT0_COLES|nr:hypothetical protein [Colocasia esculenta]
MQQALLPLKPKLPRSCRRFLQHLRPPYKSSISTALAFGHLRGADLKKKPGGRKRNQHFLPFLCRSSSVTSAELDEVGELVSMSEATRSAAAPFPSPLTPAYARLRRAVRRRDDAAELEGSRDDVEEACRSFESYLVEMIVEEGEVKDLRDVEELLYFWENLKDPLFVELVSRFYGDLCRDLFSERDDEAAEYL